MKCNSINKVAQNEFITQQGLQKICKNLEKELGVTLFISNNKGVYPTILGESFLNCCADVVKRYNFFLDELKKQQNVENIITVYSTSALNTFFVKDFSVSTFNGMYYFTFKELPFENSILTIKYQPGVLIFAATSEKIPNLLQQIEDHTHLYFLGEDCDILTICHKNNPLATSKINLTDDSVFHITSSVNSYTRVGKNSVYMNNIDTIKSFLSKKISCYHTVRSMFNCYFGNKDYKILKVNKCTVQYYAFFNLGTFSNSIQLEKDCVALWSKHFQY